MRNRRNIFNEMHTSYDAWKRQMLITISSSLRLYKSETWKGWWKKTFREKPDKINSLLPCLRALFAFSDINSHFHSLKSSSSTFNISWYLSLKKTLRALLVAFHDSLCGNFHFSFSTSQAMLTKIYYPLKNWNHR